MRCLKAVKVYNSAKNQMKVRNAALESTVTWTQESKIYCKGAFPLLWEDPFQSHQPPIAAKRDSVAQPVQCHSCD